MIGPIRNIVVAPIATNAPRTLETGRSATEAIALAKPTLPHLLELAADLSASGPPIDYARIAQIRRAIADGSYKIDTAALAKAIVHFDLDAKP